MVKKLSPTDLYFKLPGVKLLQNENPVLGVAREISWAIMDASSLACWTYGGPPTSRSFRKKIWR